MRERSYSDTGVCICTLVLGGGAGVADVMGVILFMVYIVSQSFRS